MKTARMNLSLALSILLLIAGIAFTLLAATSIDATGFTLKLFLVGPLLLFLGIATLIAPLELPTVTADDDDAGAFADTDGADTEVTDKGDGDRDEVDLIDAVKRAPKWKWAVWLVAIVAGFALRDAFLNLVGRIF